MTKTIITGDAGFSGSAVIKYLQEHNYVFFVIDNSFFRKL
ncbi:MAG: NAD-dependent epimerase/dehydratase family protein [Bacteroidota bacterium]|nr:NAD-dependent epimerase/dehydratase family protein [Bacteroidota bacterium]